MVLEKALIKYNKKGEYELTLENKILEFESREEADKYVKEHIEKDIEYYYYESFEDLNESNHYKVIICNNYKK